MTHWPTLVVRYFSSKELSAPTMAMTATATTAKLRTASLFCPIQPTITLIQPGGRLD